MMEFLKLIVAPIFTTVISKLLLQMISRKFDGADDEAGD